MKKKIGFEEYCKWKQISLFLLSLHFVLIAMALTTQELDRCLCQRVKPYANAELEALGFFLLSLHPDKLLTHRRFGALLSCI